MTCIVALKKEGEVYLGGDRCVTWGSSYVIDPTPKIFKKGEFLVGTAGSVRFGDILEYKWKPPKKNKKQSDREYIHNTVTESLRKILKNVECAKVSDNVASVHGVALFIYNREIYVFHGDFSWTQATTPYSAIGSGADHAEGSLHAYLGLLSIPDFALRCCPDHERLYPNGVSIKHSGPRIRIPWGWGGDEYNLVTRALQAAADHIDSVRKPFDILSTKNN